MISTHVRRYRTILDETHAEIGRDIDPPVRYCAAMVVTQNPYAGRYSEDLAELEAIGAEMGGMFAINRHGEALLMVPVTVRMSYLFSFDQFDVPLFANAGAGFMKLADLVKDPNRHRDDPHFG